MIITETPNGWEIEPSTSDERKHLEFLFFALREAYASLVSSEDYVQANHSPSLGQTQNMVSLE